MVILTALTLQAGMNFLPPLRQQFPAEFTRAAAQLARELDAPDPTMLYAEHLYPVPDQFVTPQGVNELTAAPHPLQYLPYQYEGFTSAERQRLRTADIRMRALIPRQ